MSCNACHSTPCTCECCDANNEPLSSALDNFVKAFFGTLTKTCVDGKIVWTLPCDLEAGCSNLPRNEGEGIACYLLRLYASGVDCTLPTPPTPECPAYPVTVYKSGGSTVNHVTACTNPLGCHLIEPQILENSSSLPINVTNVNTCNAYVSVEAVAYDANNILVYSNHISSGNANVPGSGAPSVNLTIGPADLQCNAPCIGGGIWCNCEGTGQ